MHRRPRTPRLRAGMAALAAVATAATLAGCGSLTSSTAESDGAIDRLDLIVPADPGGGWDQTARAMQSAMQDADVVSTASVENVGGAGGTVGLAKLANETEPNTLMVMGYVMVGAVELNAADTTLADTTPIAKLTEEQLVVVVPADSEYQTIDDLLADARERGRGVSIAGGSAGGADHILAGLLYQEADVPTETLNYIPYSGGGESLAALLGDKVSAGISGVGEYADQIESGKLRALGVSGEERTNALPDVPTISEQGVDVVVNNWRGVVAPGTIDDAQADRLGELVEQMHDTPEWDQALTDNDWADAYMPRSEFEGFLDEDVTTVRETLRSIGLVE